jgi:phospholipid transport system substrate-binding protein
MGCYRTDSSPPGRRIMPSPVGDKRLIGQQPKEHTMTSKTQGSSPTRSAYGPLPGTFLMMLALLAALFLSPLGKAQTDSPTTAVKSVVDSILVILRKPDFDMNRDRPAISAEVRRAFDATAMAQSVLSTNWRDATPEQQSEFRELLLQTIENTYIGRIQTYSNETVNFGNEQISNDRASVDTSIVAASGRIPVTYKLRKRSDGWFVYDVEIENVSMVSTYRETYRSVVRRSGMDGLLEQMRSKAIQPGA